MRKIILILAIALVPFCASSKSLPKADRIELFRSLADINYAFEFVQTTYKNPIVLSIGRYADNKEKKNQTIQEKYNSYRILLYEQDKKSDLFIGKQIVYSQDDGLISETIIKHSRGEPQTREEISSFFFRIIPTKEMIEEIKNQFEECYIRFIQLEMRYELKIPVYEAGIAVVKDEVFKNHRVVINPYTGSFLNVKGD
jgi:hypothetical protein